MKDFEVSQCSDLCVHAESDFRPQYRLVRSKFPGVEKSFAHPISISPQFAVTTKWNTYGDLNAVIGKDEGGVGAGELGGRHVVDGWC